jgi:hypothetical protein
MKTMKGQGSGHTPTAAAAAAAVSADVRSLGHSSTDSTQAQAHPQQQQQQQPGLLLQPLQHAQGPSAQGLDQASPVLSPFTHWPSAPQQQQQLLHPSHHSGPQLQLKVQQLLQSLSTPQHKPCSSCGIPGR